MLGISTQQSLDITKLAIRIFILLLAADIIVVFVGQLTDHWILRGTRTLFHFDFERNLPTYFSSVNLLFASILSYMIYQFHRRAARKDITYWRSLSIGFLFLSIDEFASIHEQLTQPMRNLFSIEAGELFYFAWVIPAIAAGLILAIYFLKFYLGLQSRYRLLFGLSALVFIAGAIGMEISDGFFAPDDSSSATLTYQILVTVEESLEMIGVILFNYSLVDYLKSDATSKASPAIQTLEGTLVF